MIKMFSSLARKILGTSKERDLKHFRRVVERINALEPEIQKLNDLELRAQTGKLKSRLAKGETLDQILPEAFATVRETARRTLQQRPFDVQLMGAIALHEGYIPEMKTGEGKTLTATLAIYLNALTGKGVHVVTVNDYLAQRDALWMKPIYDMLGLSVKWIINGLDDDERRAAYAADITYGTNNEFGFDYLRDNMKFSIDEMVQRPFYYAIVDEVDSILIDEARTPLIISGSIEDNADEYRTIDKAIPKLVPEDYEKDEKHKSIALTDRGNEHIEQILRDMGILTQGNLYDAQNITLVHHVNQALRAHKLFQRDVDYIVKDDAVVIIDEFTGRMMEGRRFSEGLHQALEAKENVSVNNENQTLASVTFQNYFRMYPKLAGMTGTALTEEEEFEGIYNLRVVEIPTNVPIARIDEHDEIYRTANEKYKAITKLVQQCQERLQPVLVGTTSIEKSELLSRNLRKMNIKHNVLNARYHEQEAAIIAQAGKPGAVTIATNMAGRGTDIKLGGNFEMRVEQEIPADLPAEERVKMIEKIRMEIDEAYKIVKEAGGLYVIGSERHESRRIDNQLRGRSGRQGDPGASKFFISLEDDLMRIFGSERMDKVLQFLGLEEDQAIIHPRINATIAGAQKKVEGLHFEARKNILKFDNVMNDQRRVVYDQRREIMMSDDVSDTIHDMRHEVIENFVADAIPQGSYAEQWDTDLLKSRALRDLGLNIPAEDWAHEEGTDAHAISERLKKMIDTKLTEKHVHVPSEVMRQIEKTILLQLLDQIWKEHLLNLEYLRQGIHWRGVGQKDPLNEYRREAFTMFEGMLDSLREKVTSTLCLIELHAEDEPPPLPQLKPPSNTVLSHGENPFDEDLSSVPRPYEAPAFDQEDPETWAKTPRNAACPCGSGKKYKYCHGRVA